MFSDLASALVSAYMDRPALLTCRDGAVPSRSPPDLASRNRLTDSSSAHRGVPDNEQTPKGLLSAAPKLLINSRKGGSSNS